MKPTLCDHCDLPIPDGISISNGKEAFCCHACEMVFDFIKSQNLGEYYEIREQLPDLKKQAVSKYTLSPELLELDQVLASGQPAAENPVQHSPQRKYVKFYVDGLHCFACVWLLEKLAMVSDDVLDLRVNYFDRSLELSVLPNQDFRPAIELILSLGYNLHPVSSDSELQRHKQKSQKKLLYQVGVAGVVAGNIMLCAVSVYAGATGFWKQLLDGMSAVFFLAILFYSSTPIFKNAYNSLKNKQYTLDIAAAFSVILGSALSYYHLFSGTGEIYFDSLAIFVFLLLGAKYLVMRSQGRASHLDQLNLKLTPSVCMKVDRETGERQQVKVSDVKEGELVALEPGMLSPFDGVVWRGQSFVDSSVVTGESEALAVAEKSKIHAGSRNVEAPLIIQCTSTEATSSLSLLLNNISRGWKAKGKILGLTEKISFVIFALVLVTGLSVSIFWGMQGAYDEGARRLLAILVIACPCALGIGAPLSLSYALKHLLERSLVVKDADVIAEAAKIERVFFDKTGTLTKGQLELVEWTGERTPKIEEILYTLELQSLHPIAQAVTTYLESRSGVRALPFEDFEEEKGVGVTATIEGQRWSFVKLQWPLSSHPLQTATACQLRCEDKSVATIYFRDEIQPEARHMIDLLKKSRIPTGILSGDRQAVVHYWAKELGIDPAMTYADLKPQEKADMLSALQHVAMVGDGINDALALSQADLGIAVKGSLGASLRSSRVVMLDAELSRIPYLLDFSKRVIRLIRRNVIFSLAYNGVGILLAAFGVINPLVAAVLMPISSLWIIFTVTHFFAEPKLRVKKPTKTKLTEEFSV